MITIVYSFDSTDRFYLGTDHAYSCPITGEPLIPACATLQVPPSIEIEGEQIAVFISEEMGWTMVDNNFWQPPTARYQPEFGNLMTREFGIIQYEYIKLCKFPGIPRIMAPATFGMALSGRLAYMQRRLVEIVDLYKQRSQMVDSNSHFYEKIATEDLVLQMKRVVDEIFMNEWILLEGEAAQFAEDHIIRVCEMQDIDKLAAGPTKTHLIKMREEDPDFFKALTDLRNSFAHHFPVAETYSLSGLDHITVNTLHVPRGQLNKMRLIEVWLEDLVKSFNRFMVRTFG